MTITEEVNTDRNPLVRPSASGASHGMWALAMAWAVVACIAVLPTMPNHWEAFAIAALFSIISAIRSNVI